MVLESLKQPVINGYLIAGSLVGPGGMKLVKVCTGASPKYFLDSMGSILTAASRVRRSLRVLMSAACASTLQPAGVHRVRCQCAASATHVTLRT
jgi:hypothetical protein